ncbi:MULTISPECIES: transcriptional repressor [Silvimonas]|uniref:transcriptional repressor n=1 Tax=Silvimonas TaxID=300264 RepID=UPI0024B3AC39|nr:MULTISPECIES: transcriptional repressor [Silvimonas]MDR3427262.1 transcriptional repressor [Silvimonas sp.]
MNTQEFLDYAEDRCREHGTRLTTIRRQVLERIADQPGYSKAYDLLEALRPGIASLTPPTIYRALEFLETEGLVHRLEVVNGYVACQQHDHAAQTLFIICPCCGKVAEARGDDCEFFFTRLLGENGFGAVPQHLEVKAFCNECQATGATCQHEHMHPHRHN